MSRTPMAMRSVTVDGVELEFEERGSGEPVVFDPRQRGEGRPAAGWESTRAGRVWDHSLPPPWLRRQQPGAARTGTGQHRGPEPRLRGHDAQAGHRTRSYRRSFDRWSDRAADRAGCTRRGAFAHPSGTGAHPDRALRAGDDAADDASGRDVSARSEGSGGGGLHPSDQPAESREIIDGSIGDGAYDEALTMADMFFGIEMASLQGWSFGRDEAQRITQPVLFVMGDETPPPFREVQELLAKGCHRWRR